MSQPAHVTHDQLARWIHQLGFEPHDVRTIKITAESMRNDIVMLKIVTNARNADGDVFTDRHVDDLATQIHWVPMIHIDPEADHG